MLPRRTFADQPLNLSRIPTYRAEHFPYSGPYPWLDQPGAEDQIEAKLRAHTISSPEADLCRYWSENGYIILPKLIDPATLDSVWDAYEKAIRTGKIQLPPEPAGGNDPHPGRYLNP